jgi:hypothetical protein
VALHRVLLSAHTLGSKQLVLAVSVCLHSKITEGPIVTIFFNFSKM